MMMWKKGGHLEVTVGEKIHYLRMKNGMTMDDLAKAIGVQRSAINKYEKGMVVNLKRSTIAALSRVFGVLPSYFIDDDIIMANIVSGHDSYIVYDHDSPPVTSEARILAKGIDKLDPDQRAQALAVVKAMFASHPELFDEERE